MLVYMGALGHVGCPPRVLVTSTHAVLLVPARLTSLWVCVLASMGDIPLVLGVTARVMIQHLAEAAVRVQSAFV